MRMVFPTNMTGRFLDDLAAEMNTFVETVLGEDGEGKATSGFAPRMDVDESETGYEVSMDLPGVLLDDVNIDVEDDHIVVHGTRNRKESVEGTERRRVERTFGEFRRVISLPKLINKDGITANFENGVLSIVMPKVVEEKTSRRVVINGATATEG